MRRIHRGIVVGIALGIVIGCSPSQSPAQDPVTVAFFGDQGLSENARAVLRMVVDEGADLVLHQGDLDYADDPVASLRDSMRLWWRFAPAGGSMGADPTEAGAQSPVPSFE